MERASKHSKKPKPHQGGFTLPQLVMAILFMAGVAVLSATSLEEIASDPRGEQISTYSPTFRLVLLALVLFLGGALSLTSYISSRRKSA